LFPCGIGGNKQDKLSRETRKKLDSPVILLELGPFLLRGTSSFSLTEKRMTKKPLS
jgi:hypothetical protein